MKSFLAQDERVMSKNTLAAPSQPEAEVAKRFVSCTCTQEALREAMLYAWVQPSHPLLSPSPPVPNPSQLGWEHPKGRAWQPTPVFLPGESQGRGSLVGYNPWPLLLHQTQWSPERALPTPGYP